MTFAIRAEGIGKVYRINQGASRATSLREALSAKLRGLLTKAHDVADNGMASEQSEYWALKDVSFEVGLGERVGVIGANGAGKSTLLKILSRVTAPSCGQIEMRGNVASLLEVGTGFHPELSGRENVYLSGAILGMPREEIRRKFDHIVEFSGVEKFIDTPVKYYSSGMYVRLAFSVSAWLDPDILILDEVLAVGDQGFQKKCEMRMRELTREGRTILFVSHSMATINQMCQKALYLENGRVISFGSVADMTREYNREVTRRIENEQAEQYEQQAATPSTVSTTVSAGAGLQLEQSSQTRWRWHRAEFSMPNPRVEVVTDHPGAIDCLGGRASSSKGDVTELIPFNRETILRMQYRINYDLKNPLVPSFNIYDELGTILIVALPETVLPREKGIYEISCEIPALFLNAGRYTINANLADFTIENRTFLAVVSAFRLEIEEEFGNLDPRRHGWDKPLPGFLRPRLNISSVKLG
jgi:lipopolysaccharide transport system ATP-binding protein